MRPLTSILIAFSLLGAASADDASSLRAVDLDVVADPPLALSLRVELPARPADRLTLAEPLELELATPRAEQGDVLVLRQRLHPTFGFFLAAALDDVALPRLDAVDRFSYFSVGGELRLTPRLTLFVEDFMPTVAVLGEDVFADEPEGERFEDYQWDGSQLSLGARYEVASAVRLEGALVAYVLSETRRDEGLGGYGALSFDF